MSSPMAVWSVGWFVVRITQKLRNAFPQILDGGLVSDMNRSITFRVFEF